MWLKNNNWRLNNNRYEACYFKVVSTGFVTLNNNQKIPLHKFKAHRATDGSVIYWQYSIVGPGRHMTYYTLWHE